MASRVEPVSGRVLTSAAVPLFGVMVIATVSVSEEAICPT